MKHLVILIGCMVAATALWSQDKHFTQFYASPLTMNPALAGNFGGKYRVGAIYRDQWRGALDNPFVTFAGSLDLRFNLGKKRSFEDAVGGGILFFSDRVGGVDFNTNQMALVGSYHKALDRLSTQYLSVGLKFGFSQRNVNYETFTFQDQFDGINGYNLPSGEELPENNFAYPDMAAGLYYTVSPKRLTSYYAGVAFHHFNLANASFFKEQDGSVHRILVKINAHLGARFPVGEDLQLYPRAMISMQGPHIAVDAGANLRIALNDYGTTALHVGSWVRPVRYDTGFGMDAVIAMAGLEIQNVILGLSYDANINGLAKYGAMQGAFELSVVYLGEYENETVLCPTF